MVSTVVPLLFGETAVAEFIGKRAIDECKIAIEAKGGYKESIRNKKVDFF
jgi:hypothetical protein